MKKELELGQKFHEILEYYHSLSYKEQKELLLVISKATKQPPYYILFKLDRHGLLKMAKAVSYCKKYDIPYTPEKLSNTRVRFCFENMSERNKVLIGRLII